MSGPRVSAGDSFFYYLPLFPIHFQSIFVYFCRFKCSSMRYNFDEIIDRTGTSCKKYDGMMEAKGREDLMPFWIADMDFKSCDAIVNALKARLEHPVFGYHKIPDEYYPTIAGWVKSLHGW